MFARFNMSLWQAAPAPQVAQAAPAAAAPEEVLEQDPAAANAQPEQGDAPSVGGGEGEESLQLRRFVDFFSEALAIKVCSGMWLRYRQVQWLWSSCRGRAG